ncbi:hypothetical protein Ancab_002649 [Ancistrocladus abbreviatus]
MGGKNKEKEPIQIQSLSPLRFPRLPSFLFPSFSYDLRHCNQWQKSLDLAPLQMEEAAARGLTARKREKRVRRQNVRNEKQIEQQFASGEVTVHPSRFESERR